MYHLWDMCVHRTFKSEMSGQQYVFSGACMLHAYFLEAVTLARGVRKLQTQMAGSSYYIFHIHTKRLSPNMLQ